MPFGVSRWVSAFGQQRRREFAVRQRDALRQFEPLMLRGLQGIERDAQQTSQQIGSAGQDAIERFFGDRGPPRPAGPDFRPPLRPLEESPLRQAAGRPLRARAREAVITAPAVERLRERGAQAGRETLFEAAGLRNVPEAAVRTLRADPEIVRMRGMLRDPSLSAEDTAFIEEAIANRMRRVTQGGQARGAAISPVAAPDALTEAAGTEAAADPQLQRLRSQLSDPKLSGAEREFIQNAIADLELHARGRAAQELSPPHVTGERIVSEALKLPEREVEALRPVTEPVGRAIGGGLAETAVLPAQPLRIAGEELGIPGLGAIPSREEARQAVEPIAGEIAAQGIVPSTLIPIPVLDPAVAKLLGIVGRVGARVARPVLERLAARAAEKATQAGLRETERAAFREAEVALREAASGRAAQGAPLETRAVRRGVEVPPAAAPEAAPLAAREPTVKRLDLEGREIDTFATEREFGGIREEQARLPIGAGELPTETAGPLFAAGARTPFDDALRDVRLERQLAEGALADPRTRRARGATADLRQRIAARDEEEAIIRGWQERGISPDEQATELLQMEEELANQAARLEMRGVREFHPPFGSPEAAEREFARRGIPSARQRRQALGPGMTRAQLDARGLALDEIGGRLRLPEIAVPGEAAGGAPLTRGRVLDRVAAQQLGDALVTKPERQAREAWRLYEGAKSAGNLRRTVWKGLRYEQAERAGLDIVRGAETARATDTQIGMVERIWGAIDPDTGRTARGAAGQFPLEQRPLVENIYRRIDDATQRIISVDPEFAPKALPEYFPHLFKTVKQKPRPAGVTRGFTLRPGFLRRRKLEGMLGEILNDRPDLDLATWDPIDLVTRHEAAVDNYVASLEAVRRLRAAGAIRPAKAAPSTWRTPNVSSFRVRQKLDGWVAEPKVATMLEQTFGESAFDQHGALRAVKSVRDIGFRIKVAGGLFQQIDYTARGLGRGLSELSPVRRPPRGGVPVGLGFRLVQPDPVAGARAWFSPFRAVARSLSPALDRATLRAAERNPYLVAGYRNGLAADVDPAFAEEVIRGLGALVPQTAAGRPIPGARALQQVTEFITGGMYRVYHREMLEQGYLGVLRKHLNAGVELEEAARLAAEETNVFFSSIPNWQSAVKSPTGRDIMRVFWFATGELEGWFRLPVQAPAGFAGIMGMTVIAAELLNKLWTGNWLTLEQLEPYSIDTEEIARIRKEPSFANIRKAAVPGIDYNTKFLRPELPWRGPNGRRIYLDLLGQADTPFRWTLDPLFAIQTRLGQIPRLGLDVSTISSGEAPAFGEKVRSPRDLLTFAAQQVSPIAISGLAGTERGRIGLTGAGIQAGGLNISAQPIRERFAELYTAKYGEPPPEGISPRTLDADLARQAGYSETTEFQQEREAFLPEETERLAQIAAPVLQGDQRAAQQFREEIGRFFAVRRGVTKVLLEQLDLPEGPGGRVEQLIDQYRNAGQPPLDERGQPDYEARDVAQDDILDDLRRELSPRNFAQVQKALTEPDFQFPKEFPGLQQVYEQYSDARAVRDELADIQQYKGVSQQQQRELDALLRDAGEQRDEAKRQLGSEGVVSVADAIRLVGRNQGKPDSFIEDAVSYQKPSVRQQLLTNEYAAFLYQHEGELRLFYPYLYTDFIDDYIRWRRSRSPASKTR